MDSDQGKLLIGECLPTTEENLKDHFENYGEVMTTEDGYMLTQGRNQDFFPGEAVDNFIKTMCRQLGIDCYDLMLAFTGKNCCLNDSTVELFLQNEPQPTSTRNFVHLAQMIRGGNVTMYGCGSAKENKKHYGQKEPPAYNMSNIPSDLPFFLTYGGRDALSDIFDLHLLLDSLKFHQKDKLTVHYIHKYAHVDFLMGINAKQLVYDHIIAFFKRQR